MQESATIKMAKLAWDLQDEGKDIISLSLGEPDFDTPSYIKSAAINAIENNFSHYPPVPGFKDLKQAISDKFKNENGLDYSPEQIVVSTGAKHSLMNVVLCLVNPGDEVILPAPYWVSYEAMALFAEGKVVSIESSVDTDFKITPEQLENAITDKTKLFIFSNPCNPSGTVYSKEELQALSDVFAKNPHVYIISDEIYELINFQGKNISLGAFESIKNQVITVNGLSKGFAMTGWRLGYIGAPLEIAKACSKVQGQFTSGANAIAQKAAVTALNEKSDEVTSMTSVFKQRRDLLIKEISKIDHLKVNKPEGAFYLFPDMSAYLGKSVGKYKIDNVNDFCMYLLEDALVATTPGDAFGCPHNFRISYATNDEQLIEAVSRIKKSLDKLYAGS